MLTTFFKYPCLWPSCVYTLTVPINQVMIRNQSIVILTGAGISADSGIATFRGSDGLWEGHRIEDVATPEGFSHNPDLVHAFYNQRRADVQTRDPNPAHLALARLEKNYGGSVLIVTQNIDDLHERAGSQNVLHMHGSLFQTLCVACQARAPCTTATYKDSQCALCHGALRPDVVWFGEMPYYMDEIEHALETCDIFLSIGTSGTVYPAAGFIRTIRSLGRAHSIEMNLEPASSWFHETQPGPARLTVPAYVDRLLEEISR